MKIRLVHKGEPLTKSNAHYFFKGRVYIPPRIVNYEKELRETASKRMIELGLTSPISGPIKIIINYYLGSKRTKDLPNLPKTTCDALAGVVYDDDTLICDQRMKKFYDKKNPRVEIIVEKAKLPSKKHWPLPERYLGENPDRAKTRSGPHREVGEPQPKSKRRTKRNRKKS
jgi:Holliday junction resolvase RusA-like endonuclease